MDIESVDELRSATRAVRRRLDLTRPVEPEVILECLQLAMQAPTASNDQNWRWLVITDADKRAKIAELYRSPGADHLANAAHTATDPQTRRVYESAHALTDTPGCGRPSTTISMHWKGSPRAVDIGTQIPHAALRA